MKTKQDQSGIASLKGLEWTGKRFEIGMPLQLLFFESQNGTSHESTAQREEKPDSNAFQA